MKYKIYILIIFIIFSSINNDAAEKPTLIVYDIKVINGAVTSEQASILSNRIRSAISNTGKYLLISQSEIYNYVREYNLNKQNSNSEAFCNEDSCMIDVALAINAGKIISG